MLTETDLCGNRLESSLPDAKPAYTQSEARAEAERCLYCHDAPCVTACPTEIDIPTFIKKIATGNTLGSARTILSSNILGYSCARVCPVEVLCVGACVYNDWHRAPIQIGKLQRYATELSLEGESQGLSRIFTPKSTRPDARSVALIGAGPASLACAAALVLEGHRAVIFEKNKLPGGLNTTGVAPYKLHAEDSLREVAYVRSLGVEIRTGIEVGKDLSVRELSESYDSVFLGIGLGADTILGIPGEDAEGVHGATAYIERIKNQEGFSLRGVTRALVVGGGNTAIDIARELAQLGVSEVSMVYRRSAAEMSGYAHEMHHARLEGVRLVERAQPTVVLRNERGRVKGLRVRTSAGEYEIPCNLIVLAIGQSKLRSLANEFKGVALDARGCVLIDPKTRRTGNPKVWAGGDAVNGGKEVVNAVADGRDAARDMMQGWSREVS